MAVQQWQQQQDVIKRSKRRKRLAFLKKVYGARSYRVPSGSPPAPPTQTHYRRAADTIILEPNGNVLMSNGIDPMQRFTPYAQLVENSGVVAPITPVTLAGTGSGQIVGTYYAYVRFVDRDGNYSSLSPLSNAFTPSVTVGTVTAASNASPIVVTFSGSVTFSANQIVKISGVMGNTAANGIWAVGSPTATTISLLNGDGTNSFGNGVYNSGGSISTGVSSITYTNVPVPTEAKVVRRQILRNKDGEASVFYVDIDTADLTSLSFTSNTTSLSLSNPVAILDTSGNSLTDFTIPPNWKKVIGQNSGRIFAVGIEPYAEGAVALTNGSNIVTGIGTEWNTTTFPGRLLQVAGGNLTYTILSVQSNTQLTLTTNYSGSTDPYAYYTIIPAGPFPTSNPNTERRTLYWSKAGFPEGWPAINSSTLAEDPGAGELVGLMEFGPYLYILAQSRIYQFSWVNDPLVDGFSTQATQRGCVNNKCWIKTEDYSFMMDYRGFHLFAGNEDNPIGTKEIQDLFRPKQVGPYKINWSAQRNFHAVFDPGECIARWFVTLNGNYAPYHAIAYQVRLRRWWIEEYPFPVGCSCLGRLNGKPQVYLGSDNKRIFAINTSSLDAVDGTTGTVQGVVGSAGLTWFTDGSAVYATTLVGCYVTIIRGTGKGQRRRILSVSGTTINVDQPWVPGLDLTSMYQIGGVSWKWKSGWHKWAEATNNSKRAVDLTFKPVSTLQGTQMRLYSDFNPAAATWGAASLADSNGIACIANDPATDLTIDATKANGYVWQQADNFREHYTDAPRFMAVELSGTSNQDVFQIRALTLEGVQ
jgi:hypothetical protein